MLAVHGGCPPVIPSKRQLPKVRLPRWSGTFPGLGPPPGTALLNEFPRILPRCPVEATLPPEGSAFPLASSVFLSKMSNILPGRSIELSEKNIISPERTVISPFRSLFSLLARTHHLLALTSLLLDILDAHKATSKHVLFYYSSAGIYKASILSAFLVDPLLS